MYLNYFLVTLFIGYYIVDIILMIFFSDMFFESIPPIIG